jgi:hypothetical protein
MSAWRKTSFALVVAALLFAAAAIVPSPARCDEPPAAATDSPLGETPAEISQRYGPVLRHNARVRHHQVLDGGSAMDGDLYQKNGIIIRVVFQRGRAVLLEYNRAGGALTSADIDLLLAATAGGFLWEQGKDSTDAIKMYHRTDNKAVAHWTTDPDGSLLVAAEDAYNFDDKLLP